MTLKVKGNKMRIDFPGEASLLADLDSGSTITLMHTRKIALRISGERAAQIARSAAGKGGAAAEKAVLQPTGKKETVRGRETEIYTTTLGGQKATYWIAREDADGAKVLDLLKRLQATPLSRLARMAAPQPEDFPGVPVKTEVEMGPGQKVTTTLLSIRDEPVRDAEFAIPPGYRTVEMPPEPGKEP